MAAAAPPSAGHDAPAAAPADPPPASRPIPLPAPVRAAMRAIYKPQIIESVFYDSAASDAEDDAFIAAVRRRATADGGDSPTAAARGLPVAPPAHGDDATRARVRAIRKAIVGEGDALRARHPWLEPAQDAIGAALIAVCVATNVAVAVGFAKGAIGWPVAIVVAAFAQSILHEVEHDLIHGCYFLKRFGPSSVNAALAVVYACRLSTINPWSRRKLHINHHVASGTRADLEERAITNGQPWGPFRLLLTGDNALAVALRPMASLREFRDYVRTLPEADAVTNPKHYLRVRVVLLAYNAGGYFPFGAAHYGAWYAFLVDAALKAAGLPAGLLGAGTAAAFAARVYAAAFAAPNFVRTFCLHFVSSNVHYVGIGRGDVMNQTQVLTSPAFYPFQLFCFNFGGTHAIHHFVVRDPFYIRQAIAGRVLPVMRANGVRFNDFGTFARANRLPGADAKAKLR